MSIVERERNELQLQLREDENYPEKCFIEQALTLLNEREQSLLSEVNELQDVSIISRSSSSESESVEFEGESFSSDCNRQRCESSNSDNFGSEEFNSTIDSTVKAEDLEIPSANTGLMSSKIFYFYQGKILRIFIY